MAGPVRKVDFSGLGWTVRASTEPVGPGPNLFSDSPDNVWVDTVGRLHLRITNRDGIWRASEVILDRSLGHGGYRFRLASAVGGFDPAVVLGLFTYAEEPDHHHREIDIEFGSWPDAPESNARYTVQPAKAGNGHPFVQPIVPSSTHEFRWTSELVSFQSRSAVSRIARWTYRGLDIPPPGNERTHINLWLQGGRPPSDGAEVEVVLAAFSSTPL